MSSHPTSIWRRSSNKLRQGEMWLECLYFIGLFVAALILFLVNLDNLPLIDWNEGIVAQVAQEIYQTTEGFQRWIFPTLWGKPYLEQPPLVHSLIAIAYLVGGINEFTTRLPGAFLAATSVILVYSVGREILIARVPALLSALIYLTCLPVVCLGRLAMLDGPLLCFELLTIWAILRSRHDLRWSVVAGIGLSLLCLTKGILGLPILAIAILFLLWDTPRLIGSSYFWAGISLGFAPSIAWYAAQWFHYHEVKSIWEIVKLFLAEVKLAELSAERSSWFYLFLLLQYSLPWLVIIYGGLKLAVNNIHWGWGKLIVVWSGVYLGILLVVMSQQPRYILPAYPVLALAGGAKLDSIRNLPSYINYPRTWTFSFGIMAISMAFLGLYFGRNYIDFSLPLFFAFLALTLGTTAFFLATQERQFMSLLFWGLYVSLFLLVNSSHWAWGLKTAYPVKSIAALINSHVPETEMVYASFDRDRPSLNFYSDHQVLPAEIEELKQLWHQDSKVYLLVDRHAIEELNLPDDVLFAPANNQSSDWRLAIKTTSAKK